MLATVRRPCRAPFLDWMRVLSRSKTIPRTFLSFSLFSIPDICFWAAISEPFFTQSRMKREVNVLDDYSFSPLFENVHPRVRYLHLRIFLETDDHTVSCE